MKKLLPLLLAVMLIVAMAVPAFAVDAEKYSYNGVVLPALPNATSKWVIYEKGGAYYLYSTISSYLSASEGYTNQQWMEYIYRNDQWEKLTSTKVTEARIVWTSVRAGESSGNTVLDASTPVPLCTGSTCPATDVNEDNVCDDCGMTFAVLRNYPPEGWPSSVPAPPAGHEYHTLFTEQGKTWVYMTNYEPLITIRENADEGTFTLIFTMDSTGATHNIQRYYLDNGEWVYSSVGSIRSFTLDESLNFLYSTKDIYDIYGDRFFPIPLWGQVGQVTQRETESLYHQTMGTMGILVPCGIGLLTLLVALVLLAKKFRLFLP